MNLSSTMFLLIPTALVVFKLAILVLAATWAVRSAFASRGLPFEYLRKTPTSSPMRETGPRA